MKKTTWTLLFGLVFILTSCSDDFEERVQIRVRNVGQFNYENVIVSSNDSGEVNFGLISSNRTSEYKPFKFAYQYAFIKYSVDGIEFKIIPDDYLGEEKLKRGKYTYEVTMDSNKKITFKFIRD